MTELFEIRGAVELAITLVLFSVKAFALVDALTRPAEAFTYVNKQTKQLWLLLLGLAVVLNALQWAPFGILNLLGTVAALVYLADVRPALQTVRRR